MTTPTIIIYIGTRYPITKFDGKKYFFGKGGGEEIFIRGSMDSRSRGGRGIFFCKKGMTRVRFSPAGAGTRGPGSRPRQGDACAGVARVVQCARGSSPRRTRIRRCRWRWPGHVALGRDGEPFAGFVVRGKGVRDARYELKFWKKKK